MADDDLLSQDEIDALLNGPDDGDSDSDGSASGDGKSHPRIKPFDPANQYRAIRGRLHTLDIINERFARQFRVKLFNLIRRTADITIDSVSYQSYKDYVRNLPVPTNLNLISMKPLRGTALVAFPTNLVFMIVDNLFGGDGRFVTKTEGREFTNTEQRVILRVLNLALDAYQSSWQSVYKLDMQYIRSETQAQFVNVTNSPNEIIVNSNFRVEVGTFGSQFQICIPYSMIEPLHELLTNPGASLRKEEEKSWNRRLAGETHNLHVELSADFVSIPSSIQQVKDLSVGSVLPFDLPNLVTAKIGNIPVLECDYGTHNGQHALRVDRVINHIDIYRAAAESINKVTPDAEDNQDE